MAQKKNNVELDKDTRILKHRKKEVGKKSHHAGETSTGLHVVKPEKREHDYMYLHHLDDYREESDVDIDDDIEDAIEEQK